jgi:hypothetical protein
MTRLLVKDVDADCDEYLNDEKDQCSQPVPHDGHSLLLAAATRCNLAELLMLSANRRKETATTKQAPKGSIDTEI